MASADEKISDVERGFQDEAETAFNEKETDEFIPKDGRKNPNGHAGGNVSGTDSGTDHKINEDFYGLSRDELDAYAKDPKWVKVRWILFAVFIFCWAAMLIAAIVIVVVTPKCPPAPNLAWYQTDLVYKVDVSKFQDSNADGIGDLNGLKSKVDHFKDLNVKAIWLQDIVSDDDSLVVPKYGTVDEFKSLTKDMKKQGVRTIIDLDLRDVLPQDNSDNDAMLSKADKILTTWTENGAEGFVMPVPDGVEAKYTEWVKRWQTVLDEGLNKKDDRARVVIPLTSLDATALSELQVVVYNPTTNCTSYNCIVKEIEDVSKVENPWKILTVPQMGRDCVLCDVVQKLTLPGTPNVMYGDEIGLSTGDGDAYMKWDDTDGHGFTANKTFITNNNLRVPSVLAQKSVGFPGTSNYNVFKKLAEFRGEDPSLKWGKMKTHVASDNIVGFTREAEGYDPVLVALNYGTSGKAYDWSTDGYSIGKVIVSTVDADSEDKIDVSAVYLPAKSFLVAKLSKPES